MNDVVIDVTDPDTLLAEVRRLKAEIAQLQERVELLDRLAYQDVLIDLPNRRGFMRHLEAAIDRVSRYDDSAAMLFVDIDGLKMINDTFGHQAGDEALMQVADMLAKGVRKSDCVARLGGDEFGILLERVNEVGASETADRLVSMIADCEFCFQGTCLPLSVAIGISVIEPNDQPEAVMARADLAMYRQKAAA
ncbi:GGDEF domain-containing protein [Sphingomonas daechungensis]|uniref:GGDEF domain-containing protein n=1 Tax=Sphingomonas daechungensis TaxID=1176646 RepID=UPI0037830E3D